MNAAIFLTTVILFAILVFVFSGRNRQTSKEFQMLISTVVCLIWIYSMELAIASDELAKEILFIIREVGKSCLYVSILNIVAKHNEKRRLFLSIGFGIVIIQVISALITSLSTDGHVLLGISYALQGYTFSFLSFYGMLVFAPVGVAFLLMVTFSLAPGLYNEDEVENKDNIILMIASWVFFTIQVLNYLPAIQTVGIDIVIPAAAAFVLVVYLIDKPVSGDSTDAGCRIIGDNLIEGIIFVNEDRIIKYCNSTAAGILENDNPVGMQIDDLATGWAEYSCDDDVYFAFNWRNDETTYRVTMRQVHTGGVKGLLYSITDSADQLVANSLVVEEEKRYRTVLDNIDIGLVLITKDYEIVTLNKQLKRWYPELDLSSESDVEDGSDVILKSLICYNNAVRATLKEGVPHSRLISSMSNGEERILQATTNPIIENDEVSGVIETLEDVTEQKRTYEEARRYEFVVNASRDFMTLLNRRYEYVAVSDSFCNAFSKTREDLVGKTMAEVWGFENFNDVIKSRMDEAFKGKSSVYVSRFPFGLLGERFLEVSYYPYIDPYRDVTHVVVVTRDVTHFKENEVALRRAREEAVEASRAKSKFLANMSHEIRTPMNAILGMTEVALQTDLKDDQRDYLDTVRTAAHNLLDIINDVLDLSKIEAGGITIDAANFDLYHLVQGVVRTLTVQARKKNLALEITIDPDVPKFVIGDEHRIRQIFINLIGNAIKFTHEGGVYGNVSIEKKDDELNLIVDIRDTGIGIAEDKVAAIFDSFTQASTKISKRYGGTGLGLSICKQLCNLMGGDIEVESTLGEGSHFKFQLILQEGLQPDEVVIDDEISGESKGSLSILLVEDYKINIEVASKFLTSMGHQIAACMSGAEAIEYLQTNEVDLVFMDVEMPEMDGLETTRRIRRGEAGNKASETTIVAMTAHAFKEAREDCFAAGMDDFITKPLEYAKLERFIKAFSPRQKAVLEESGLSIKSSPSRIHMEDEQTLMNFGGDMDFLVKMRKLFLQQIPEKTSRLETAYDRRDFEELRKVAHGMKTPSHTIGAQLVSHYMASLEKVCRDKLPEIEITQHFNKAMTELKAVEATLMDSFESPD